MGPRNCEAGFERRRGTLLPSNGAPIVPLAAATMAATLLAAVELMLFLRVTRCAELELTDSDDECGRDLGREPGMTLPECRCWLAGRVAIGSWIAGTVSAN